MTDLAPPGRVGTGALWIWAVRVYERPGVRKELLLLQHRFGVDLSLLLLRIWLHEDGRGLHPEAEELALELSAAWHYEVVVPLRAARDAMEPPCAPVDAEAARQLREEILSAELTAEKLQLDALERLALRGLARPRHAELIDVLAECRELKHVPRTDFSPLIAALAAR